jgi:hypothetical protein
MRRGLAVGISHYNFGELKGCIEDAIDFAALMRFHGSSDVKDSRGEQNFVIDEKQDLGRADLREALHNLFTSDLEIALFYFSGHGELTQTGGYLLTSDSVQFDPGISMDEILRLANNSPAKDKIIILDCCHSGALGERSKYADPPAEIQRGVTILTASSESQFAFQINVRGALRGAFTSFVIDALKGGAADLTGQISPGSVYTYVDKMLGLVDEQRPIFKTNVSRFTVLRKVPPVVEMATLRKLTQYFDAPDDKYKLNPSYEFTNTEGSKDCKEPYAVAENVTIFQELQKLQSIGLVVPNGAKYMYFAAMNKKSCMLTDLGKQYWALIKRSEN